MKLHTDEQTMDDLRIFGKKSAGGIYDIYNQTHTRGGEEILKEMFLQPLSDRETINLRSSIIEHFSKLDIRFPFDPALFDMIEKYLGNTDARNQGKLSDKEIQAGVSAVTEMLQLCRKMTGDNEVRTNVAFASDREQMSLLLNDPAFEPALKENIRNKLSYSAVAAFDILFRVREQQKIKKLLEYIYLLDVYLSVAKLARERKFVFPRALEKELSYLHLESVYHPELKEAVSNTLQFRAGKNVLFLTGANMAGKSTLLRSVSTALYTAHMGFPVAAKSMEFSVLDGLYTTINLPDNLGMGASHFYAEVLRLKKIATELKSGQSLFVVFDELFRGTNVKDAQEATVAVTSAFASRKKSFFIISSHIVEAAEELNSNDGILFGYLPTRMKENLPEYTYRLEKGITGDRHGMVIIRNEGILDILKNGRKRALTVS